MSAGSPEALPELPEAYRRWRASRLGQTTDALEERLILELAAPVQGLRVLDVGCGDAMLLTALAGKGASATGVDASPAMLSGGRAKAKAAGLDIAFVGGDAEALPFPDAAFDTATAIAVLCFVPDAERAVREIARVLRPGGRLVIGELGRHSLWAAKRRISGWLGSDTWRKARFRSTTELRGIVEASGLSIESVRGAVFYPPFAWCAQLMSPIDLWLGRQMTFGAAFIAIAAVKSDSPSH
ncbi:MAG: class I SAM-dependent methyltransferase [Hyphomicrobiaceae bacterium]|nr:MAG: class I SAM-dependent methyltransferase [Hyphomicrobiaceae bacterium]